MNKIKNILSILAIAIAFGAAPKIQHKTKAINQQQIVCQVPKVKPKGECEDSRVKEEPPKFVLACECNPAMIATRVLWLVGTGLWVFCKMVEELCKDDLEADLSTQGYGEEAKAKKNTWMNMQIPLECPPDQSKPLLESSEERPSTFQWVSFEKRPEQYKKITPALEKLEYQDLHNRPAPLPAHEGLPEWSIVKKRPE